MRDFTSPSMPPPVPPTPGEQDHLLAPQDSSRLGDNVSNPSCGSDTYDRTPTPAPVVFPVVPKTPPKSELVPQAAPRLFNKAQDLKTGKVTLSPTLGTVGREIKLLSNTAQVRFRPEAVNNPTRFDWNSYEVLMASIKQPRPGVKPLLLPTPVTRDIWEVLQEMEDKGTTNYFNGAKVCFDGRFTAYASAKLPSDLMGQRIDITLPGRGTFAIRFDHENEIDPLALNEYVTDGLDINLGQTSEALNALNVIVHHPMAQKHFSHKSKFFVHDFDDSDEYGLGEKHEPFRLKGGLELFRGFTTGVGPVAGLLNLTVNMTSGAFIQSGNLVDIAASFVGRPHNPQRAVATLSKRDKEGLGRFLTNAPYEVKIDAFLIRKGRIRKMAASTISDASARNARFTVRGSNQVLSVENYYFQQYHYTLKYPDAPCLQVKPGVMYPMELVHITPGHRYPGKLNPDQQLAASSFQILKPEDRLDAIKAVLFPPSLDDPTKWTKSIFKQIKP